LDLTEQNLKNIHFIHIHNMTVDEMVEADKGVESRFHFFKGIWWREVKPFFYQPAWFLTPVKPEVARPNPFKSLGGYYHIVPEGSYSNGVIVTNSIENISEYSPEKLQHAKTRYNIKQGLKNVKILIPELEHMITDGYEVYLSWKQRIGKVYKDRSHKNTFRNWINNEYLISKRLILGAYVDDHLIASLIGHAVQDTACMTMLYSNSKFHSFHPVDALVYSFILICQKNPDINRVINGLKSLKPGLQIFKKRHGFKEIVYPAYIHMNYLARTAAKIFLPEQYKRLMGRYED
jgi:hypothetical protein